MVWLPTQEYRSAKYHLKKAQQVPKRQEKHNGVKRAMEKDSFVL